MYSLTMNLIYYISSIENAIRYRVAASAYVGVPVEPDFHRIIPVCLPSLAFVAMTSGWLHFAGVYDHRLVGYTMKL